MGSTVKHRFKVGDTVRIIRKGSSTSSEFFNQTVKITSVECHTFLRQPWYNINVYPCSGVWEDELDFTFNRRLITCGLP
jgi:hypothetical protein